jgi:hypothetical protein
VIEWELGGSPVFRARRVTASSRNGWQVGREPERVGLSLRHSGVLKRKCRLNSLFRRRVKLSAQTSRLNRYS